MINADNGPENNTARTQWIKRMVEFSAEHQVTVKLACYPPYHSKYNPVERVFGVLENYWNGDPLESIQKALGMAEGMTYKGVRLTKKQMQPYEASLQRLTGLRKWFVTITSEAANLVCSPPCP